MKQEGEQVRLKVRTRLNKTCQSLKSRAELLCPSDHLHVLKVKGTVLQITEAQQHLQLPTKYHTNYSFISQVGLILVTDNAHVKCTTLVANTTPG